MTNTFQILTHTAENCRATCASCDVVTMVTGIATAVGAIFTGVTALAAYLQFKALTEIHRMQFEDGMNREYRKLAQKIPAAALLGHELSLEQYENKFDELYAYVDLSNQQICLRKEGRIGEKIWQEWQSGIQANMGLPAFKFAWSRIKEKTPNFQELRRLENDGYLSDPHNWK